MSEAKKEVTGEFPAQMASNAENVSIWWRHYDAPTCTRIMSFIQQGMSPW